MLAIVPKPLKIYAMDTLCWNTKYLGLTLCGNTRSRSHINPNRAVRLWELASPPLWRETFPWFWCLKRYFSIFTHVPGPASSARAASAWKGKSLWGSRSPWAGAGACQVHVEAEADQVRVEAAQGVLADAVGLPPGVAHCRRSRCHRRCLCAVTVTVRTPARWYTTSCELGAQPER